MVDGEYAEVEANAAGRRAISELELEVGVLEGWARFWFRGELVPLPVELQNQVTLIQSQLKATQVQLTAARDQLDAS